MNNWNWHSLLHYLDTARRWNQIDFHR